VRNDEVDENNVVTLRLTRGEVKLLVKIVEMAIPVVLGWQSMYFPSIVDRSL